MRQLMLPGFEDLPLEADETEGNEEASFDPDSVVYQPPTVDSEVAEVAADRQYNDRGPRRFVISGPRGDYRPGHPGRRFTTVTAALMWALGKYGSHGPVRRIVEAEEGGMWAFEVSIPKGAV